MFASQFRGRPDVLATRWASRRCRGTWRAQAIGIYPLLTAETCWLVAIDLDGVTWQEDAGALRDAAAEAARGAGARGALALRAGRARLGTVLAACRRARRAELGSWLLTQAMSRRSISMDSYDRLFPNQDTMPPGGFGNLIALPLQHARRAEGCAVFLGETPQPPADQWGYLAGLQRLNGDRAEQLATDAERAG